MFRILLTVLIALTWSPPSRAGWILDSCQALLGSGQTAPNTDLETRINYRYRKAYDLQHRVGLRFGEGLGIFRPIKVIERRTLLDNGALPPLGRLDQAVIIRKSREAGIQEMRLALDKSEERAWIFIPSIETWFYDTGRAATADSVANNGLLGPLLLAEFGEVELYHTHPAVAGEAQFEENRRRFERFSVSQSASMPMVAIPSSMDMDALYSYFHVPIVERPLEKVKGFVVSEFGVASYRIQGFYFTNQDGKPVVLIPSLGVSHESDIPLLISGQPPDQIIKQILARAELRSMESIGFMRDVHRWSNAEAPKFIFSFQSFKLR